MAAELVESADTPQTYAHDLESFFWVLLWVVITLVKTNLKGTKLSSIFHDVMNCTPGSVVKADFLKSDRLAEKVFEIPGNPYLRRLLEELQTTIASWYNRPKNKKELESGITDSSEFRELYEKFSLHFSEALNATGWPEDDVATAQYIPPPPDAEWDKLCGSKRSWDALLNSSLPSPNKRPC